MSRDLDVVVLGATGVTGRQVAVYLDQRARSSSLRWAAAARDPAKAVRTLAELGVGEPQTIAADVSDPASLAALAERTKVVLDLVGPYTRYGRPVIEACVTGGAHYADLTGEIPFVRLMIDEFDRRAQDAGVKVVQVCGFEALPADLAILLAADAARERWGEELVSVDLDATIASPPGMPRLSDSVSGGTLQSMLEVARAENAGTAADPAALIDDADAAAAVRRASPIVLAPRRGRDEDVIAPMMPAPFINPAVIHRTAVLGAARDGRSAVAFRYREGIALGGSRATLPLRWGAAGAMTASQVGLRALTRASPDLRRRLVGALAHITPSSGFGPAADRLEGWTWGMNVQARTSSGREVRASVRGEGHPGYLATARMLGEAGILLGEDGATPPGAGCLTPALALGSASAERFARAGVRFSVD